MDLDELIKKLQSLREPDDGEPQPQVLIDLGDDEHPLLPFDVESIDGVTIALVVEYYDSAKH